MANATNGPVDPDAGTDRRGRAARSRTEAAQPPAEEKPPRRRTVAAAATTSRSPVTAPAEPARKSMRRSATGETTRTTGEPPVKSTRKTGEPPIGSTGKSGEPPVKSTSSKTATGRAPARKTATAPVEPAPKKADPVEKAPRRRSTAKAAPAPVEPVDSALSEPEGHEPPPPPPALTRGILELAAERVAASRPRPADPEPPAAADDDPMAAPGPYVNPRATGVRRSTRSRAAARPAEEVSWDGLSAENGWLGPWREAENGRPGSRREAENARLGPWREAENGRLGSQREADRDTRPESLPEIPLIDYEESRPAEQYPRTVNRGLSPSVRLPAELPDNLWPPKSLLERNLAENIHVPAPPRVADPWEDEEPDPSEPMADEHLYVAAMDRGPSTIEIHRHEDPEPEFLPSVLAHPETESGYVPAHSRTGGAARHAVTETAADRRVRRRRRTVLVAYLLLVILVLIVGHELRDDVRPLAPGREAAQRADEPAGIRPPAGPVPQTTGDVPAKTDADGGGKPAGKGKSGEFGYATERGPILGDGGRLYRFRVAVEKVVDDTSPSEFADAIDETLGDERSWINDGRLRLRRVPRSADADFTVYLASAKTSEKMCATGGLETEGYTSCRIPGQVIINADRWADAVPEYEGKLDTYRRYTINHEVGHELGHGHEACPGEGKKAPVMQQQTFGLKGCTPNPWPYLDGERYAGEPVA